MWRAIVPVGRIRSQPLFLAICGRRTPFRPGENDRDDNGRKGADRLNQDKRRAGNTLLNQHGENKPHRQILADGRCVGIIVIENHMTPGACRILLLRGPKYAQAGRLWTALCGGSRYDCAIQKTVKW